MAQSETSPEFHGTGNSGSSFQMEDQGPKMLNLAERLKAENRRLLDKVVVPIENVEQIISVFPTPAFGFERLQVTPLPNVNLGQGGFGFVFKAFRKGDKNKPSAERTYYAVKEMKLRRHGRGAAEAHGADEDDYGIPIHYLQMEYLCLKLCAGHPNVIRLVNAFAAANNPRVYFLLEYCEMGDLGKLVRSQASKRLPLAAARRFFKQVAEGLNFVHARQVAHRDIKLSNVLLTRSKKDQSLICKITDFGLSNIAWIPTRGVLFSTAMKGTRQYMAPEIAAHYVDRMEDNPNVPHERSNDPLITPTGPQIRMRPFFRYDPLPTDIWALGVMLFVMVTGSFPFSPITKPELELMWKGKFTKYACMPAGTNEFLKSLIHPHPVRRANMRCILFHDWMKEGRRIMPPMEEPLPAPKVRERTKSDESKKRSTERRSSLPVMRSPEPFVEEEVSGGVAHEPSTSS